MGGEVTIRPFDPSDQVRAKALIISGLAEHFNTIDPNLNPDLNNIEKTYPNHNSLFLVAELDGKLIATGALITETRKTGRIVRLSVSGSYRRKGIGRIMTEKLIEAAHDFQFSQIVVETNDDWHDAIRLYQNCGFNEYSRHDGEVYLRIFLE